MFSKKLSQKNNFKFMNYRLACKIAFIDNKDIYPNQPWVSDKNRGLRFSLIM